MTNPTVTIKPKIEVGQVWVDGHGRKVRIVCTDRRHDRHPVIGLKEVADTEVFGTYSADGRAPSLYDMKLPLEDLVKLYIPPKTYTAYCLQYVARDQLHVIACTTADQRDDIVRRYSGDDWDVSHIEAFDRTITVEG